MKIFLSATSDLITDHRLHRTATSLLASGAEITVIGRKTKRNIPLKKQPYSIKRFKLLFNKGPLFYSEFNIRLFFYLLFRKTHFLVANDLDTLLANYPCAVIKKVPLIYDTHEYFTELPELIHRKRTRKIWLLIEKCILPKIKHSYTVSESIAREYNKKYNIDMQVIRNLPHYKKCDKKSKQIGIRNKKVVLYQGVLNKGRGIETIIKAMKYINDACFVIIGDGILREKLHRLTLKENVSDKVMFTGRIPYQEIHSYTCNANIGIVFEEKIGLNYYYSLPNKLFDYIQANVPVLCNNFPETSRIVKHYDIGITTKERNPESIAKTIKQMLNDAQITKKWKKNLTIAAKELCWENEKDKLIEIFKRAGLTFLSK